MLRVTLSAIARRGNIALTSMGVSSVGHLGPWEDGQLGFTSIDLTVDVETETSDAVEAAAAAAEQAESGCLIAMALAVPVNVSVSVRAAAGTQIMPAA